MSFLRLLVALALVCICTYPTFSQIESGTLILVHVFRDKIVVAGDSLVRPVFVAPNGTAKILDPEYKCKVFALNDKTIFAWTGTLGFFSGYINLSPPWTPQEVAMELRAEYPSMPPDQLAIHWANIVVERMNEDVRMSFPFRQQMDATARREGPSIANGLFVSSQTKSGLEGVHMNFSYDLSDFFAPMSYSTPETFVPTKCDPFCGFGEPQVFLDPIVTSEVKTEFSKWDGIDVAILRRMIELASKYDKTGTIGGRVDIAVLPRNNTVQWIENPNCK
jgi:hypothetical protein